MKTENWKVAVVRKVILIWTLFNSKFLFTYFNSRLHRSYPENSVVPVIAWIADFLYIHQFWRNFMWKNYNYVKPAKSKDYYKAIKSCPNSTVWILFGLNLHLFVINFDGILFGKITIIKMAVGSKHVLQSHQELFERYSVDFGHFLHSFVTIFSEFYVIKTHYKAIKSFPNSTAILY